MRFVNEPVLVEARVKADGAPQPLAFVWQGRRYGITQWGRTWVKGGVRGFLVMTPAKETFELHFLPDGRWVLARAQERPNLT